MEIRDINRLLVQNIDHVLDYLLPQGVAQYGEYCVGSVDGEPGDSLKVHLRGRKAGVWCDFANPQHTGDLVELWRLTRNLALPQALKEIKDFLRLPDEPRFVKSRQKTYKRPEFPPYESPKQAVLDYLCQERLLTKETLGAFQVGESGGAIYFPFYRDGKVLHWKKLSLKRPNGKKQILTSSGTEPILFGWQALESAYPNTRYVVICEGEIDAMTLHQYGIPALSVPFGGGGDKKQQWVDCEYDRLERFEEIYLCMDQDASGKEAVQELVMRLGAERCRVMELPAKDPNECLQGGMTADEVQYYLKTSQTLDPEELQGVGAYRQSVLDLFYPDSGSIKQESTPLPWAKLEGYFELRAGELTIWTGINGHGKSQMLGHAALHMILHGQKVCIASMEIKPERLLYKLTKQAAGVRHPALELIDETFDWLGDGLWLFNVVGTAKTHRLLEVFHYARKRYGVNHFVVDSLLKCGLAEDDYNGQKLFVEQLCDFKNQYDCHIHLVVHPRKGNDEYAPVGKMDVKGSGAITDLADNIVSVWRNKKKEEMMAAGNEVRPEDLAKPDAFLTCAKQRNGEWEGRLALWFDRESGQFLNQQDDKPSSYSKLMKPF